MDVRNSETQAWLVKVPHALATIWKVACEQSMTERVDDSQAQTLLGRIVQEEGNVSFLELPDNMIAEGIPRRFKLQDIPVPSADSGNKRHVVSYELPPQQAPPTLGAPLPPPKELIKPRLEGTVVQRMDLLPMVRDEAGAWTMDAEYLKLVRHRTEQAVERTPTVQTYDDRSRENVLDDLAQQRQIFKDMNRRRVASLAAAKAESARQVKLDKDELEGLLFKLYERQSAWTFKALVAETRQPQMHLKAVLEGIATQQKRGPNKDKYELKSEYRRKGAQPAVAP